VRSRGRDAERHQPTTGGGERALDSVAESVGVGDHVVGGHDEYQRVGFVPGEEQRSNGRRRCGVAPMGSTTSARQATPS
jgi:hypothetical protein